MDTKISAVWVYWAAGADGDELKYSMRSVCQNFKDIKNAVICGDKPNWFIGDFINSPKFSSKEALDMFGTGRFAKWTDSIIKLKRICKSDLVTDDFLWLYDDTFFVSELVKEDLEVPRATGQLFADVEKEASNKWREVLKRTAIALREQNRPARNFSHHGPVIYNKKKLLEVIELYDPFTNPRAIESLYLNHVTEPCEIQPLGDFLQYAKKPSGDWIPRQSASIVNVGSFKPCVEKVMQRLFPNKSCVETEQAPQSNVSLKRQSIPQIQAIMRTIE